MVTSRPGHETSRDKNGLGPGTSCGLAGGSRDVSRPYSSGLGMSRDFYSPGTIQKSRDILPSSAQSGIYNKMNSISEYK